LTTLTLHVASPLLMPPLMYSEESGAASIRDRARSFRRKLMDGCPEGTPLRFEPSHGEYDAPSSTVLPLLVCETAERALLPRCRLITVRRSLLDEDDQDEGQDRQDRQLEECLKLV
jgi:hypothetical protein